MNKFYEINFTRNGRCEPNDKWGSESESGALIVIVTDFCFV